MSRLPKLDESSLTERQQGIYREILDSRGGRSDGPFVSWLRSPELADRAQKLGAFCLYETSLPARLSELAILITAQWWRASVEWQLHAPIALEAGLTESVIQAIRIGERPDFEAQDEALVYDLSRELYWRQRVGDHTYAQAVAVLGEQAVVELIGILGYYALVAMTLNVFEVEASGSDEPPFPD